MADVRESYDRAAAIQTAFSSDIRAQGRDQARRRLSAVAERLDALVAAYKADPGSAATRLHVQRLEQWLASLD